MYERNETHYQLEQDNKVYILTTSLIDDKIKLKCQDSYSQIFIGMFDMSDLLRLSRYFTTTNSIEQIQTYLNGIIENQRVGIFPEDNSLKIVLYLVNNDKITIPLAKAQSKTTNNYYNNYNTNNTNVDQYIQNPQNSIVSTTNYLDTNYFSDHIGNISQSYLYQQKSNEYYNNNLSPQSYYIEQNINKISNFNEIGDYSIPYNTRISNANNQIIETNYLPTKANISPLNPIQKISSYPQANTVHNNFKFNNQSNEKKLEQIEDNTNNIKLEQENLKNEMKKVLDEVSKLREENELVKKENSSLINENKTLRNENENYQEQILNYQNDIKAYKDENDSFRNQLNEIQKGTNEYKNQNDELLKMKEAYESENKASQNNLEQIMKENELLKEEIEELKKKLTIANDENQSLSKDINILKNNLANQKKTSINEDEIKKLIEENSIFRIKAQENELLKKQIEDLQYQIQMNEEKQEYDETQEVKGDIIHDMKELEMITKKINKENKKIIINLLYKASADSDKAAVFHEKCDKAKNTIVLVETKDGMRFGGYTACSWSGNCVDKNDQDAFIFSFDKMKTYDNIPGDEAIGCYPKFGPIFLGCQIKIYDNAFTKGGTTYEKELNFNTEEDYELTGGKRTFEIKDIEVYEVIFE